MAGKHAAPASGPPDPRARRVPNRRPGPKHTGAPPAKKAAPKKAAPAAPPVSAAPASAHPAPAAPRARPAAPTRSGTRARAVRVAAEEGRHYAVRQAFRATNAKPSITGRAVGGAAAGAASGAAIGSVVPGVGTAVGAGAGAVVGGAGGGIAGAKAKKAYKAALRPAPGARKLVVAEFAICIVIAALSPLTTGKRDEAPGSWMKRMTAIMGIFFLLGLLSAGGRGMARAAAGFGGLVTVVLAVSERNLFAAIADRFGGGDSQLQRGPGPGPGPGEDGQTIGTGPPGDSPSGPSRIPRTIGTGPPGDSPSPIPRGFR